jgi:hypothetical protein
MWVEGKYYIMKGESMLMFSVILSLVVGLTLMSGCVEETGEEGVVESLTGEVREPPTWSFNGILPSKNDSHTYELDLRGKYSGCLLTLELAGPNPELIYLILSDSKGVPIQTLELGYNQEFLAVVGGGEIYQMVVKTREDKGRYYEEYHNPAYIEYTVNVRLSPHSVSNSSDTAVQLDLPGRFESKLIPRPVEGDRFILDDITWFRIGPLDSSGLLVVDSNTPSRSSDSYDQHRDCVVCPIYLLNDRLEVVGERRIGQPLYYPVNAGDIYYIKIRRISSTKRAELYPYAYLFGIDIDLVANSPNNNPDNALPIHLLEALEGRVVSIKDTNWFRLDLGDYSSGDIIINISLPDDAVIYDRMKMELLGENQSEVVGYVYVQSSCKDSLRQSIFMRGMPKAAGYYPKNEIGGGGVYYLKVYLENVSGSIGPPVEYKLEARGATIVPRSVMDEEPSIYTLTSNTADAAVTVNLPARMSGGIMSEDDVQWFKTDLNAYPGGGILVVTLTMPAETEPSCGFVCRQPVCFNVPKTPPDCSHYRFRVFEGDRKTEVVGGSAAPKDEKTFRHVLEKGAEYYFKISAPHGRYNKEEPYTIDVRFYPGE